MSESDMHKEIGARRVIEEVWNPQPITCSADKGTNEGGEVMDWIPQALKENPNILKNRDPVD